ncbi:Choline/Carnitine o-acyltransferase [Peptoclostridium litorale DSM 5388]|uniref:Putative acetyltransferase n=1 Tax=Peptoclostridium litorale DSM 5388 TaxID=1121324 RepID=A0A069RJU5_PEPLI|nr:choline/carnitine O-acyltransferase [Peptoclostridium litorale]KDR96415.1 putative acetyltransferase [Peptoclostridium litorale DSM 5388]SIN70857.1 Choline/Carnitine o-acyltransferase [Peptoclostridium litorale DSM 5388]
MNKNIKNSVPILNLDNLPKYPIPSLEETLERYIEWAETLVDEKEHDAAKKSVEDFLNSKSSKLLEKKLRELGERENDSWIFDYWVKCHLDVRAPLSPHTNVPIIYENERLRGYETLEKIAIIIHAISKVYLDYRKEGARSYTLNGKLYSSDQLLGLLASINHIKEVSDEYYISEEVSDFVVFTYKNRFFNIRTIKDDSVIGANDIYRSLEKITRSTGSAAIPGANYVTIGTDRDRAGVVLAEILKDEGNRSSYEEIKNSIFIFNLDGVNSNSIVENLDNASYDPELVNRWHGKGLQFSCSSNGVLSFIADHSYVDGGTELLMVERVKSVIDGLDIKFEDSSDRETEQKEIDEIIFNLGENVKGELNGFKSGFDECMKSFETRVVEFEGLSRDILRENGVLSADGFMHMAFQAAQYMTFGEVYNTYISVDARKFFRGRTECNRPVSKESIEFAKSLFNKDLADEEFRKLLNDGLNEHHRRTKLCQSGNGVNRYLFVLESIYKDFKAELGISEEIELFGTKAYQVMGNNRLSTTSFTHENMKYLYFPPVVENGLGIYYLVDQKSFIIITAFNEHSDDLSRFNENLKECVEEMLRRIAKEDKNAKA